MGASTDWTRERFTMDLVYHMLFAKYLSPYDEGLIYRKKRLVNWDPHFKTAISDFEVMSEEEDGFLMAFTLPPTRYKCNILLSPRHDLKLYLAIKPSLYIQMIRAINI